MNRLKRAVEPKEIIKTDVFEKRRFPYLYLYLLAWIPIAYVLFKKAVFKLLFRTKPKTNYLFFDGLGTWGKKIKEQAASWKAMNIIYNHPFKKANGIGGWIDEFWWFSQNCQAVRNRFKLVKQEVKKAILHFSEDGKEVRLVSLACGSAQGIIEAMAELKAKGAIVKALLIDIEQGALDYSKNLAEQNGVGGQIKTVKADVYEAFGIVRGSNPDIIEMLGLLDYLTQENAVRLVSSINESLAPGGVFLTCNIRHNPEQYFIRWVIDWNMIYRSSSALAGIIKKSGFETCRYCLRAPEDTWSGDCGKILIHKIMANSFEIIVRAVIEKDNKILVCKNIEKKNNYYYLPGGHAEIGEPAEKALIRELKEELNLSVKDISFIGAVENVYKKDGKNYHEINLVFNVGVENVRDKSYEDHLGFFFFDKSQFSKETVLPKALKEAVTQWQKDNKIFWRSNIES